MNFLSHVAVVEPLKDRLVLAGSVLPDLLRHVGMGHHRRPRPRRTVSPAAGRTREGIEYHIDSDTFFHYSPWFAETTENLQAAMADGGNPLSDHWSRWLLPHLLIEIAIDAHLAEIRPDLPPLLYAVLREFAEHRCCPEVSAWYDADPDRLRGLIGILCANRRPETYNTVHGVADALRRVLAKEGKEVLRHDDEPLLAGPLAWLRDRLQTGPDIIRIVREGIGLGRHGTGERT